MDVILYKPDGLCEPQRWLYILMNRSRRVAEFIIRNFNFMAAERAGRDDISEFASSPPTIDVNCQRGAYESSGRAESDNICKRSHLAPTLLNFIWLIV